MTTQTELSRVHGLEENQWRSVGIDLTCGTNNHVMIAQRLLGLPSLGEVQNAYRQEMSGIVSEPLEVEVTATIGVFEEEL